MGILSDFSRRKAQTNDLRNVGDRVLFEYHCFESDQSCDAELWYHSHQPVEIISQPMWDGKVVNDEVLKDIGQTKADRDGSWGPVYYRVRFDDGFERDATEDELLDSEDQYERPDPPAKPEKRRAQSDMENYAEFIEMVPIETVKKFRHVDRSDPDQNSLEPEEWEELKQSIAENGWTEPLIMVYFAGDNTAVLGEGNHRLAIAEQLGLAEIPIRVYRYSYSSHEGPYAKAAKPVRGHPKAPNGYIPADLKPSDIGLI